jgi:hypothetical protein
VACVTTDYRLLPGAKEFVIVLHLLGRPKYQYPQQPPHLFTDAEALLVSEDDARVRPAGGHVLTVEVHEVANVEGIEDAPDFGSVREAPLVGMPERRG